MLCEKHIWQAYQGEQKTLRASHQAKYEAPTSR